MNNDTSDGTTKYSIIFSISEFKGLEVTWKLVTKGLINKIVLIVIKQKYIGILFLVYATYIESDIETLVFAKSQSLDPHFSITQILNHICQIHFSFVE